MGDRSVRSRKAATVRQSVMKVFISATIIYERAIELANWDNLPWAGGRTYVYSRSADWVRMQVIDIDKQIVSLKGGELLREVDVKLLCARVREIFIEESNV